MAGAFAFGLALASPLLAALRPVRTTVVQRAQGGVRGRADEPIPRGSSSTGWRRSSTARRSTRRPAAPGHLGHEELARGRRVGARARRDRGSDTRGRLVVPFFGVVALFLLAKAYGMPGLQWIGELPVVERVDFLSFGLPCVGFALALLAATGVDGIRRAEISGRRLLVALGGAVVGLIAGRPAEPHEVRADPRSPAVRRARVGHRDARRHRRPRSLHLEADGGLRGRRLAARRARAARAGLRSPSVVIRTSRRRGSTRCSRSWSAIRRIGSSPSTRCCIRTPAPRTVCTTSGCSTRCTVDRYFEYLKTFVVPGIFDRFAGSPIGSNEGETIYRDNQMFDLLGVRYLVSTQDGPEVGFLSSLIPPGATTDLLDVRQLSVGGEARTAIFAARHRPSSHWRSRHRSTARSSSPTASTTGPWPSLGPTVSSSRVVGVRRSGARDVLWSGVYAPGDSARPGICRLAARARRRRLVLRSRRRAATADRPAIDRHRRLGRLGGHRPRRRRRPVAASPSPGCSRWPTWTGCTSTRTSARSRGRSWSTTSTVVAGSRGRRGRVRGGQRPLPATVPCSIDGLDVSEQAIVEADPEDIPAELTDGSPCPDAGDDVEVLDYDVR